MFTSVSVNIDTRVRNDMQVIDGSKIQKWYAISAAGIPDRGNVTGSCPAFILRYLIPVFRDNTATSIFRYSLLTKIASLF